MFLIKNVIFLTICVIFTTTTAYEISDIASARIEKLFHDKNLSLYTLKKDMCDICSGHAVVNNILDAKMEQSKRRRLIKRKLHLTCRGCSLNRLPEVKKFVMEDAPNYEKLDVKFITGAEPEIIFLDESDNELERLRISHLSRSECNELIQSKGFSKRDKKTEF